MRKRTRWLLIILGTLSVLLVGGVLWIRASVRASLPLLAGTVSSRGLEKRTVVRRDAAGIPVLEGESLGDCLHALGFLHAQDRFFQMDLARRRSAGELSFLVGSGALEADVDMRRNGFRVLARKVIDRMDPWHREALAGYVKGVNAGLAALGGPPPEYLVLRADAMPWREEDTLLVAYTMFELLAQDGLFERIATVLEASIPSELARFLTPETGRYDVPLIPDPDGPPSPQEIPGKEVIDLRAQAGQTPKGMTGGDPSHPGSNNFAVAGVRTTHGGALLANDMHLGLSVPTTWYRAQLEWEGHRAAGLTLPGVPGIIAGTNGEIAWGFTNASGDFQDWIVVEVDPADEGRYLVPGGSEPFSQKNEVFEIQGEESVTRTYRTTRWGAVAGDDHLGRPLVLMWTALLEDGVDMGLLGFLAATDLEQGLQVARGWRGPPQNVLVADRTGRIGYVLSGYLPKRRGYSGRMSESWADGSHFWDGELDEKDRPTVVDPPSGILYTANNRTVPLEQARLYGRVWDVGLRAHRIKELLQEKEKMDEQDLLRIQLDTRSEIHDFYRDLLLEVAPVGVDPGVAHLVEIVRGWNGRADVDQAGFRIVRELRRRLHDEVLSPLVAPCDQCDPQFRYLWFLQEEPVRRILEERPLHLLSREYEDYPDLVLKVATRLAADLAALPPENGADAPWGRANVSHIQHPFSGLAPAFSRLLDMPPVPLPGDSHTVRAQGPTFGASERLVVCPSRLESGLLHVPCGQSGHFLSPHFADGHAAWVEGRPTPLLAGPPVHELVLEP